MVRQEWTIQRIRALRRYLGMTQSQFAEELGTEQQRVSEWETGVHQPSRITAKLLSLIAERSGFVYPDESAPPGTIGETMEEFRQRPVSDLDLSPRAVVALARADVTGVGQVLDLLAKGDGALLAVRGFGRRSLEELKRHLGDRGLRY